MWRPSQEKQSDIELCVVCGSVTEYEKDTPISERVGYVEGAGQLCHDRYKDLYLKGPGYHG